MCLMYLQIYEKVNSFSFTVPLIPYFISPLENLMEEESCIFSKIAGVVILFLILFRKYIVVIFY
jgi:hypothetical protein